MYYEFVVSCMLIDDAVFCRKYVQQVLKHFTRSTVGFPLVMFYLCYYEKL